MPPVKIILERRRNRHYRKAFLAALPDEDVEVMVNFLNKASGWLFVAGGGLLLAISETYLLVHAMHWNLLTFRMIVVLLAISSVANTAYRIAKSQRLLGKNNQSKF